MNQEECQEWSLLTFTVTSVPSVRRWLQDVDSQGTDSGTTFESRWTEKRKYYLVTEDLRTLPVSSEKGRRDKGFRPRVTSESGTSGGGMDTSEPAFNPRKRNWSSRKTLFQPFEGLRTVQCACTVLPPPLPLFHLSRTRGGVPDTLSRGRLIAVLRRTGITRILWTKRSHSTLRYKSSLKRFTKIFVWFVHITGLSVR